MSTAATKHPRMLIFATIVAIVGTAFAAEQAPTKAAEPSQRAREQMAKMHEEMATCLRSDRKFADCRTQMHQHCMNTMGEKGCPMMGADMQHRKREPAPADQQ
jgi:hypothetical protein